MEHATEADHCEAGVLELGELEAEATRGRYEMSEMSS